LKQVVEALRYLHGEHVVHGDVRGPNILLDDEDGVVVTDFGLSVYADSQSKALMSTRGGSQRWSAPEITLNQNRPGHSVRPTYASDIWSFAMVCFELFTLDAPWGSTMSETAVQKALSKRQHPPRPALLTNDALWTIVQRCCAPDPRQRP
ncbi:hypothetical protein PHLGIDRAFT_39445, partial [Phlebiopsis gigantea 11061_1 CR5-6]